MRPAWGDVECGRGWRTAWAPPVECDLGCPHTVGWSRRAAPVGELLTYGRKAESAAEEPTKPSSRCQRGDWAQLMRRAFGYDLLTCASCGGKMVYLSCVLRRDVIAKILARAGPAR